MKEYKVINRPSSFTKNNEKLEDILNYLKEDTPFNYKIEENKVIIIATTKTQTQMK